MDQGENMGFHVDELVTEQNRVVLLQGSDDVQGLMAQAVYYTGLLTITDADKFRKALTGGVGELKRFGFGLLTVDHPKAWYHLT